MGSGGNLPAGETFISPENGTAEGVIVFDGSISLHDRDILINSPIICTVEKGFVREITGGREAYELRDTVTLAERNAVQFEKEGRIPAGFGEVYAKNARNIGELGIGLNPEARISGNMLEDEKAFNTCHFAIGQNYDEDAPSLIHLDGLVKNPTIIAIMPDGDERVIERDGVLAE
jgi:leucyl aminopeptidase (aminopeptidase T)